MRASSLGTKARSWYHPYSPRHHGAFFRCNGLTRHRLRTVMIRLPRCGSGENFVRPYFAGCLQLMQPSLWQRQAALLRHCQFLGIITYAKQFFKLIYKLKGIFNPHLCTHLSMQRPIKSPQPANGTSIVNTRSVFIIMPLFSNEYSMAPALSPARIGA